MRYKVTKEDLKKAIQIVQANCVSLLAALDTVESAVAEGVTTPVTMSMYLASKGFIVDGDWCARLATYLSITNGTFISSQLVLLDEELVKFIAITSTDIKS